MGTIAAVLPGITKALSCQDCARYVCNSMGVKSRCCDCFDCELQTNEVEIAAEDNNSEFSVEVEGCFEARSK